MSVRNALLDGPGNYGYDKDVFFIDVGKGIKLKYTLWTQYNHLYHKKTNPNQYLCTPSGI